MLRVRRWAPWMIAGGVLVVVLAVVAYMRWAAAREAEASRLASLQQQCVEAMLKNACAVMAGPPASPTAEAVFVAGVGAVDATAYRELRASGEAMCSVVRQACERDWNGSQCRVGRSLWLVE